MKYTYSIVCSRGFGLIKTHDYLKSQIILKKLKIHFESLMEYYLKKLIIVQTGVKIHGRISISFTSKKNAKWN